MLDHVCLPQPFVLHITGEWGNTLDVWAYKNKLLAISRWRVGEEHPICEKCFATFYSDFAILVKVMSPEMTRWSVPTSRLSRLTKGTNPYKIGWNFFPPWSLGAKFYLTILLIYFMTNTPPSLSEEKKATYFRGIFWRKNIIMILYNYVIQRRCEHLQSWEMGIILLSIILSSAHLGHYHRISSLITHLYEDNNSFTAYCIALCQDTFLKSSTKLPSPDIYLVSTTGKTRLIKLPTAKTSVFLKKGWLTLESQIHI